MYAVLCLLVTVSESILVCLEPIPIEFVVVDALSRAHILLCRASFVVPPANVIDANGENVAAKSIVESMD